MAEGWARRLYGEEYRFWSAGIETHGLNPHAVKVMAESGIDISGHRSKTLADIEEQSFDVVITVCDHAHETCPILPVSTRLIHKSFPDPPRLAQEIMDPEAALEPYRMVCEKIRHFMEILPEVLQENRR